MLTARNTLDDKLTAFRVGTNDYLVKPFAMAELVARLHALTQPQQHAKTLKVVDMELHLEERYAQRGSNRIQPGPEDWRALVYLARKSPKVVNRVELEDYLWPEGAPSSDAINQIISSTEREKIFVRCLSHELRTLMAVTSAALDILDKKELNPDTQSKIKKIRDANSKMISISDTLLNIWQEQGKDNNHQPED
jgi:signal transduction histidine kinase